MRTLFNSCLIIFSIGSLCLPGLVFSQSSAVGALDYYTDLSDSIFGDFKVNKFDLHFYCESWQDSLIYYYEVLEEEYFPAQLVFADTLFLDSIGVRYKGNSSYVLSSNTPKKPLKFKFDEFIEDQAFFGLKRLNFSNCLKDPSFMREKIAYDIARHYMPAPRTAYANLFVDGELLGFYVQVEQIDKSFLERYFPDNGFNLYKACDDGATLEYKGPEQANYEVVYELKTNEELNDYTGLIEMIDCLNNTPAENFTEIIENYLNLDNCIRFLAFNMTLSHFDSYSGSGRNFYLYDDSTSGQFNILPWDLNESFGVYKYNWDIITQDVLLTSNMAQRPLFKRIIENDSLKQVYLDYIGEMIDGPCHNDSISAVIDSLQSFIYGYVQADSNKLYSYQLFLNNLENDVALDLGFIVPGLKSFSELRNESLNFQVNSVPVHPGDADNNGLVDAWDVLPLGIYFAYDGNGRGAVSFAWENQRTLPWDTPAATYADANGDGVVDEIDAIGIGVNWGNTHSSSTASFEINLSDSELLAQHSESFRFIYNSLSGEGDAVKAIKVLLESILNITAGVPLKFSLEKNYPNPFNGETVIAFTLPEKQVVTLTVYNLKGQVVAVPLNRQWYDEGRHQIKLDLSNFSSGIYIYRIATEKGQAAGKMVMIK